MAAAATDAIRGPGLPGATSVSRATRSAPSAMIAAIRVLRSAFSSGLAANIRSASSLSSWSAAAW